MEMVVALDVHRNQITFKALDRDTGEVSRGRIAPRWSRLASLLFPDVGA